MPVQFELLPSELIVKILSHLTFGEIAGLRQVCKEWKKVAELWFNSVRQLSVNPVYAPEGSSEHIASATTNLVFFTNGSLMKTVECTSCPALYRFLHLFCPNLEVLDAEGDSLSFDSLSSLGSKLIYFSVLKVDFEGHKLKSVDLLQHFPALQAFDITSIFDVFCHKVFHKNRDGKFIQWVHPCVHGPLDDCGLSTQVFPSTAKSLTILGQLDLSSIEAPLAQSLVLIQAAPFTCTKNSSSFPNLRFLISSHSSPSSSTPVLDVLTREPNSLQYVCLYGECDADTPTQICKLSSCKQLKTFSLKHSTRILQTEPTFNLADFELPPELEHLNLGWSIPLTLKNSISKNLCTLKLELPSLEESYFEFPNLKYFSLVFHQMEPEMSWLFDSLTNSPKLEYLRVMSFLAKWNEPEDDSQIDGVALLAMSGLVIRLENLRNLQISFAELEGESDILVDMALEIDQSHFTQLEKLILSVPLEISPRLGNNFKYIKFLQEFQIVCKGTHHDFQINNILFLDFDRCMSKVVTVEFVGLSTFFNRCELIDSCPNIKKIVIDFSDDIISDEITLGYLTSFISTWPSVRTTIKSCICTIQGLIKHLSKPCDPCPEGLRVYFHHCDHLPEEPADRLDSLSSVVTNLKDRGVIEVFTWYESEDDWY